MRVASGLLVLLLTANAVADDLTYSVTTDKSSYAPGETVTWQSWLTLSNVAGTNFGVQTASFNMALSEADVNLSNVTIGAPFSDYTFRPAPDSNVLSALRNVGAGQIGYNAGVVEVTPGSPGPTLLAEGQFVTKAVGSHTITLTADTASRFFTDTSFGTSPYANLISGAGTAASFTTAVPEPSTIVLGLLGTLAMVGYSRRRRKAKAKAEKTEE